MRCHYEVLQVERDISTGDLRKAFFKLALKWHPDKIKDGQDVEEATQIFQEIQSAYEVLSDPQERAWYDDHRDQILRGDDGTHNGDEDDDRFDVMRYFSTSAYAGFKDDDQGFYAVYRRVFEEIDALDRDARGDARLAPAFGTSKSDVPLAFYDYWRAYMTDQSFSWLDQYKTTDAPNREIRRLMEKDNKKLRDAGKKTFSANVRALVDFVRKRDKRMIKYLKEKEEAKAAAAAEKEKAAAERKAAFEAEKAAFQAAWEAEEESSHTAALLREEVERRQAKAEVVVLVCDLCKKEFKSEKQVQNHLGSKKHREQMILAGLDPAELDELLALEQQESAKPTSPYADDAYDSEAEAAADAARKAAAAASAKSQAVSAEEEEAKRRDREDKEKKAAEKRQERKEKRKTQKKDTPPPAPTAAASAAPAAVAPKGKSKGKAAVVDDDDEFGCGSCPMTFPTLKMLQKHLKKERHEERA
ncbi:Aste57867_22333 [Aphanomyces stellatus]|uniref:Aste57867_22333 protein n=1 Tax=Aphanomyces stellatus TaxID=120398 RepID=A0A485LJT6_9STRA|nr:hypothetical protein As57867_022263 [Aphanomyces stellatus]VFT98996.1 Aste57867_22333 [Aphanomyces stellatus]